MVTKSKYCNGVVTTNKEVRAPKSMAWAPASSEPSRWFYFLMRVISESKRPIGLVLCSNTFLPLPLDLTP